MQIQTQHTNLPPMSPPLRDHHIYATESGFCLVAHAGGAVHLSGAQRRALENNFRNALIRSFPDDPTMEAAYRDWVNSPAPDSTRWGMALARSQSKALSGVPEADSIRLKLITIRDIR